MASTRYTRIIARCRQPTRGSGHRIKRPRAGEQRHRNRRQRGARINDVTSRRGDPHTVVAQLDTDHGGTEANVGAAGRLSHVGDRLADLAVTAVPGIRGNARPLRLLRLGQRLAIYRQTAPRSPAVGQLCRSTMARGRRHPTAFVEYGVSVRGDRRAEGSASMDGPRRRRSAPGEAGRRVRRCEPTRQRGQMTGG